MSEYDTKITAQDSKDPTTSSLLASTTFSSTSTTSTSTPEKTSLRDQHIAVCTGARIQFESAAPLGKKAQILAELYKLAMSTEPLEMANIYGSFYRTICGEYSSANLNQLSGIVDCDTKTVRVVKSNELKPDLPGIMKLREQSLACLLKDTSVMYCAMCNKIVLHGSLFRNEAILFPSVLIGGVGLMAIVCQGTTTCSSKWDVEIGRRFKSVTATTAGEDAMRVASKLSEAK